MSDNTTCDPAAAYEAAATPTPQNGAVSLLAGLPEHPNDLAKFEGRYGFWCQSEAVFIEASGAALAVLRYRQRNRDTAEIAVSHNLYADAIGRLQWRARAEAAEAEAAVLRARLAEREEEHERQMSRAGSNEGCILQLYLNGLIAESTVQGFISCYID